MLEDCVEQEPTHRPNSAEDLIDRLQAIEQKDRQISAWNPLDWLRLLWWGLVMPHKLKAYREEFGEKDVKRVGGYLISTLLWLPLFMPSLALGLELLPVHNKSPVDYLWISLFLVGAWLLLLLISEVIEYIEDAVALFYLMGFIFVSNDSFGNSKL